jgi:DNA-binding winged helix-turn-helix (wHTH) protein/Tfp pilus assembly protein PilF
MVGEGYEFGPFRLDARNLVLWRGPEVVPLPPKPLGLLRALVARGGEVASKRELLDAVWPGTFVEEANLGVSVSILRKALGVQPDGRPYIETVHRRGYRFLAAVKATASASGCALAVLPFLCLGAEGDAALGLGLTDALVTRLSRLRAVTVRPTGAVLAFAGADPAEAGRRLEVEAVLDGRLQRQADRIRLTVQLVSTEGGRAAWAETFEGEAASLFRLQDELAGQVARALALRLSDEERRDLSRRSTESVPAFTAYVRGRYLWSRLSPAALGEAVELFREARRQDPGYALPAVGLAEASLLMGFAGGLRPGEAWEAAEREARAALAREPDLPEAHVALAYVGLFRDWDFAGADARLERAVALGPGVAGVRQWRGLFLDLVGRLDQAAREVTRACELDPVSVITHTLAGLQHALAGDQEAAATRYRATIELDPRRFVGYWGLGLALSELGRHQDAVAAHRAALDRGEGAPMFQAVLARTLARAGRAEEAAGLLEPLAAAEAEGLPVSAYQLATVRIALGETGAALDALERASEARDPWLVWLKVDPMLQPVRHDPRFRKLLARVFGAWA